MFIKDFANRRLIATPIASLIAWCVVAVGSLFLEPVALSLLTFAATGSIVYLGLLVSKFTGENFLDKSRPKTRLITCLCYLLEWLCWFTPLQYRFFWLITPRYH